MEVLEFLKKIGKKGGKVGGKRRMAALTDTEKRELGRKGGLAGGRGRPKKKAKVKK